MSRKWKISRSKNLKARRNRSKNGPQVSEPKNNEVLELCRLTTENLFRVGERLTQEQILSRLEQSRLVKRADDEFFRLRRGKFFKQRSGVFIVRGGTLGEATFQSRLTRL